MFPTLTQALFMIGTLFGLDNNLIALETELTILPTEKRLIINYFDLQSTQQDNERIIEFISALENADELDPMMAEGITYVSKSLKDADGKLSAKVELRFDELRSLARFVGLNVSYEENKFIEFTEYFYYEVLRDEKFVKSNGSKKQNKDVTSVTWKSNTKKIQLRLSRNTKSGSWTGYKYSVNRN